VLHTPMRFELQGKEKSPTRAAMIAPLERQLTRGSCYGSASFTSIMMMMLAMTLCCSLFSVCQLRIELPFGVRRHGARGR
jgi:hypothetical protein